MRSVRLLTLLVCGVAAITAAPSAAAAEYVVVVADGVRAAALARDEGVRGNRVDAVYRHVGAIVLDLDRGEARRLRADDRVATIEPNRPVRAATAGSRSGTGWNLARIDQTEIVDDGVYDFDATGTGVTAYVIDTGLAASHSEFTGRVAVGYSTIAGGTTDCDGHGTHVAGILGGATYGVAPGVTIAPVRVLDCNGEGSVADVIDGIDWMVGVHSGVGNAVANLSLGSDPSAALDAAVATAVADGITVVAAAGNDGGNACKHSPARAAAAITVGATEAVGLVDQAAPYSDRGPCVDVFAPGTDIRSAWHTAASASAVLSGTSMAAPHVAGVAALILEHGAVTTPAAVGRTITAMAVPGVVTELSPRTPNLLLQSRPLARPATAVPTVPLRLGGTASDGAVHVSWDPPAESAGSAVSGYDVEVFGGATERTTELSRDLSGLINGVAIAVRVRAVNASGTGPWTPRLAVTPSAPAHDARATPFEAAWLSGRVVDSTFAATAEPGEAAHDDGGGAASASLWYRLRPAATGNLRVSTAGSDFDTVLAVYADDGRALARDDDAGVGATSAVTVAVEEGRPYLIAVDGWSGERGNVMLQWSLPDPAPTQEAARDETDSVAPVVAVLERPRIARATVIRGRYVRLVITRVPGARYEILRNGRRIAITRSARPVVPLGRGTRATFRVRVVTAAGVSRLSAAVTVRRITARPT